MAGTPQKIVGPKTGHAGENQRAPTPTELLTKGEKIFRVYRDKALDLSRRNRLLKYPDRGPKLEFDLELSECVEYFNAPDELYVEFSHKKILDAETKRQRAEKNEDDISDNEFDDGSRTVLHGEKLLSQIARLQRLSSKTFKEHGLNTLFLAVGEISWKVALNVRGSADRVRDQLYIAPVLLIPVSLTTPRGSAKKSVLEFDPTLYPIQINPVLLIWMQQNGLSIPEIPQSAVSYYNEVEKVLKILKANFHEGTMEAVTSDKVYVGQFTYHGQQIYEDLRRHETQMLKNEFVGSVCGGDPLEQESTAGPVDDEDSESYADDFFTAEEDYTIHNSDDSQTAAIRAVLSGKHMVIHGPPGTGKSQTIANIIANLLARKKKVLFVCEKQAALDVVYTRYLTSDGPNVADLCLPLYQYKGAKRNFAKDLIDSRDRITRDLKAYGSRDYDEILEKRQKRLDIVKTYARAVITPVTELDRSPYQVFGELAGLSEDAKDMHPQWAGESVLELSYAEFEQRKAHVADLNQYRALMSHPTHWSDVRRKHAATGAGRTILAAVGTLQKHLKNFPKLDSRLAPRNFDALRTITSLLSSKKSDALLEGRVISQECFVNADLELTREKLEQASAYQNKYAEEISKRRALFPAAWFVRKFSDPSNLSPTVLLREVLTLQVQSALENVASSISQSAATLPAALSGVTLEYFNLNAKLYGIHISLIPLLQKTKVELAEAKAGLELIRLLEQQLEKSDAVCRQYGVNTERVDPKEIYELEQQFATRYRTPFRLFSSDYKRDRFRVEQLCMLQKPSGYRSVKEIINGAATSVRSRIRREEEFKSFVGRYALPEETHNISSALLLTDVDVILEYLKANGAEQFSPNQLEVLTDDALRTAAARIHQTYMNIENDWSRVESFVLSDLRKMKVKEAAEFLVSLQREFLSVSDARNETIKYLQRSESYTLEELRSDVEFLNLLWSLISDLERTGIPDQLQISSEDLISDSSILALCMAHIEEVQVIDSLLEGKRTTKQVYAYIVSLDKNREAIREWLDEFGKITAQLGTLFENPEVSKKYDSLSLKNIEDICAAQAGDQAGLEEWMRYQSCRETAKEHGLGWFLDLAVAMPPMEESLETLYLCSFYTEWLDKVSGQEPTLRNFDVEKHERIINEFKKLDEQTLKANRMRIINRYSVEMSFSRANHLEAERVIRHEAEKTRQLKSIRDLVEKFGSHIQAIKPCWMVSPLALGSYLKYDSVEFDTVIFDEASQMTIESALGAMARAKQVVVIGDEHQLPPTSFFNFSSEEEEEDEEIMDSTGYESILKCAIGLVGNSKTWLKYHYRSKAEDLIAFSNHYIYSYYNQPLVTFPSAVTKRGVEFVHVPGIYKYDGERNTNRVEAERIAELCVQHAKTSPEKSLGVIAFSVAQEEEIRDAVQSKLKEYPDLEPILDEESEEPDAFFITNLESVQGDERDTIILSVCYGKDTKGTFAQRFGPLNSDYGYRRLNVAVTRARERIVCVASIYAHDIKVGDGTRRGVQLLQKYLEYAKDGMATLSASKTAQTGPVANFDSEFEAAVASALEQRGYIVQPQVGASGYKIDLAILHPKNKNEYILGIECDGAAYHSSHTARERDRIRQEVLENYGWKLYRIWSQHWFEHREDVLDDIDHELQQILKKSI